MKEQILQFILSEYSVKPEYPFKKYPDYAVLRNQKNKKWFGVIMKVPARKLGLLNDQELEVINLKNHPENISLLTSASGILPAYHMNKENWITVILNPSIPLGMVIDLIAQSYDIINAKTK